MLELMIFVGGCVVGACVMALVQVNREVDNGPV